MGGGLLLQRGFCQTNAGGTGPIGNDRSVQGSTNHGDALITWLGQVSGSAEMDEFGNYVAANLMAGTYTFVATMESCAPDDAVVKVVARTIIFEDFEMACSAPPPTVDYHHYLPTLTR